MRSLTFLRDFASPHGSIGGNLNRIDLETSIGRNAYENLENVARFLVRQPYWIFEHRLRSISKYNDLVGQCRPGKCTWQSIQA
jgi:hypothetical protein